MDATTPHSSILHPLASTAMRHSARHGAPFRMFSRVTTAQTHHVMAMSCKSWPLIGLADNVSAREWRMAWDATALVFCDDAGLTGTMFLAIGGLLVLVK